MNTQKNEMINLLESINEELVKQNEILEDWDEFFEEIKSERKKEEVKEAVRSIAAFLRK